MASLFCELTLLRIWPGDGAEFNGAKMKWNETEVFKVMYECKMDDRLFFDHSHYNTPVLSI